MPRTCVLHRTSLRARPVRPAVPLGALLLSVMLTACGTWGAGNSGTGQERSVSPTGPSQPPSVAPSSPEPRPPEPALISPVDGQQERRLDWVVVDATGPEVIVEVQVGGPPCDVVTGLDVTEDPDEVTLTIWAGREPGANCSGFPATVGTYRVAVPLDEPLGARSLTRP